VRDENGRLIYEEIHDRWFYGSQFRDTQGRVVPSSRRYEYIYMGDSHVATIEHSAGIASIVYSVRDWRDFQAVSLDADDAFTRAYREPSPFGLETRSTSQNLAASGATLPSPFLQDLGIRGYLNNRWRTLDSGWGRFSHPDPARIRHERLPQGGNLYANNFNNPFRYVDKDGRHPVVAGILFALGLSISIESDQQADLVGVLLSAPFLRGVGLARPTGTITRGFDLTKPLATKGEMVEGIRQLEIGLKGSAGIGPSLPPTHVLTDLQRRALAENVRRIITETIPAVKAGTTRSGVQPLVNQLANPRFGFLKQIPEARAALIEALEGTGVSLPPGL
jgi:hypothetical protein